MKTTKIKISNLFGISELELDGRSVELSGTNGTGKTSVLDAIKYAITNSSEREYIIKDGEKEGQIIIETDDSTSINRKKRAEQSDYKSIKVSGKEVQAPENFLSHICTEFQLDPVKFTQMSKKEQNKAILDLINFDWDVAWIKEKFGEIPSFVDYSQNILQVLNDIQSESGDYFKERQGINRDIRNKLAFIEDIAKDIPASYNAEKWESFDISEKYKELGEIKNKNSGIERAKAFKQQYDDKKRSFVADRMIAETVAEKAVANERENALSTIERLKAEIIAQQDKLLTLDSKLADKKKLAESEYNEKLAKLDGDMKIANEYSEKETEDCTALQAEIDQAEQMKKHLNEYKRMRGMQSELDELNRESEMLTEKIELARSLPGEILSTATIPIEGFTVENGIPLINGLPVSNLSEGEQLNLCVDIAISKPNYLKIILIDGVEKLSDENRLKLYNKCKEKGLQFIATRTTNNSELEVTYLD